MRISILVMAAVLLGACGSNSTLRNSLDTRQNAGTCPPPGALYDAARIVKFSSDEKVYGNIAYSGEVVDVRLACRYAADDPVRITLDIDFAFGKGPAATASSEDFVYWVAVTRRSGKVLNKKYFTVTAPFRNDDVVGVTETVREILIPRSDTTVSAANFEVLVGFELTEDQLTYNKEGRRFRLSAGR